jgi:hypothetical protein
MWRGKCRACGYLIGPGEDDERTGYGHYHFSCVDAEESAAYADIATEAEVDLRLEERA